MTLFQPSTFVKGSITTSGNVLDSKFGSHDAEGLLEKEPMF